MRKTKILITYGPSVEKHLAELIPKVDGIRINTAFGDVEEHRKIIRNIRQYGDVAIVLDIKGPELRVSLDNPINLDAGKVFELTYKGNNGFTHNVKGLLNKGDIVLFDDGKLKAEVVSLSPSSVHLKALNSAILENRKSACIHGKELEGPSLTEKDIQELIMANEEKVEYVALSFARCKEDILAVKKIFKGGVIAKIENKYGYDNIDEIIDVSEGIMVARGDLALHIGLENVPIAQKIMIKKCNEAGKLAITATQVLKSMVSNPFPTRAEVSDIANAILDGTDVIMLSNETSVGKYPIECINVIDTVSKKIEEINVNHVKENNYKNVSDAISKSIHSISSILPLTYIVSITRSGYTAKVISRFRLKQRIYALTNSKMVMNQLKLFYGVYPLFFDIPERSIIKTSAKYLYDRKLIKSNDFILFTAGIRTKQKHASNLIEIHKIYELLELDKK